jgi:hypothetical protein
MSSGQPASRSPPGESRSSPVSSAIAASLRAVPCGSNADSRASAGSCPIAHPRPLIQVEPDRVGNRPARTSVEFGQVLDHGVTRSRAVDGDQQILTPLREDRGDRGVDDRDVVGGLMATDPMAGLLILSGALVWPAA